MANYDSICCFRSSEQSQRRRVCWELTTDCNLKCPFCHRKQNDDQYYDVNKLSNTIALLKENKIDSVIISGGEPLMHPQLFYIMDTLKGNGFDVDLCTNATIIDDGIIRELTKYLTDVSVSIDGYTSYRHEMMRNVSGCFDKTVENVRKLIEAGLDVHVTTVVDAEFASKIEEMTEFLYRLGVRSVAYLGLIPLENGENKLLKPECQAILNTQIASSRDKHRDMEINTKQLLINSTMSKCGAGKIVFGMGTDGVSLVPCLLLRKREGKELSRLGEGMCPGSKYLTAKKR